MVTGVHPRPKGRLVSCHHVVAATAAAGVDHQDRVLRRVQAVARDREVARNAECALPVTSSVKGGRKFVSECFVLAVF